MYYFSHFCKTSHCSFNKNFIYIAPPKLSDLCNKVNSEYCIYGIYFKHYFLNVFKYLYFSKIFNPVLINYFQN